MPVISFCLASIFFPAKKAVEISLVTPQATRGNGATTAILQRRFARVRLFLFFKFRASLTRKWKQSQKGRKAKRQWEGNGQRQSHKAGLKNTNAHEKLMRTLRLYREGHKVKCISNSIGGTHLLLPSTAFYEPLCCCRLRLISAASARLAVNAFGFSVSACLSHCLSVCSFVCLCWVRQTSIN